MMLFTPVLFSLAVVAAHGLPEQDHSEEIVVLDTTATALHQPEITAAPHDLHRRATAPSLTTSANWVEGSETVVITYGSLCGFVTGDIHWPIYCNPGEYCFSGGPNIDCCSTTSTSLFVSTILYTITSTDRNVATVTSVSTSLDSSWTMVYGSNCTTIGPQTCYNYNQTANCTGTCTDTALLCSDPNFPGCASIYSTWENITKVGTTFTSITSSFGVSYYCDTDAYGLEWDIYGYSPSSLETFVWTVTPTTIPLSATFTPTPTPFSRTQASRPATATNAQNPILSQTSSKT